MKKSILLKSAAVLLVSAGLMVACSKDKNETTDLKVKLTDAPIDAEEVNVDIREVQVLNGDDSTGTNKTTLVTNAGIYDLLDFQNGVDTVIANGRVSTTTAKEIRFILGPDNTIKVDGVVYPLTVPSGESSGLKIKLDGPLSSGTDSVTVDFDAALSVHNTGNGKYILRPVLRIK